MTLVQGRSRSCREYLFIALPNSSSTPKLEDELSDQPIRPPKANLLIAFVPAAALSVPKYMDEDLQRILKTILEA